MEYGFTAGWALSTVAFLRFNLIQQVPHLCLMESFSLPALRSLVG